MLCHVACYLAGFIIMLLLKIVTGSLFIEFHIHCVTYSGGPLSISLQLCACIFDNIARLW